VFEVWVFPHVPGCCPAPARGAARASLSTVCWLPGAECARPSRKAASGRGGVLCFEGFLEAGTGAELGGQPG